MTAPGLDADRVVQVVARGAANGVNPRFGSGYLAADRLVVTAAHVIEGADSVIVRQVLGAGRDAQAEAQVAWVDPDRGVDLAVLRLTSPGQGDDEFPTGLPALRFGRVDGHVTCETLGFPLFMLRRDEPGVLVGSRLVYRDTHHAVGTVTSWSGRYGGTLEVVLDPPREDPDPLRSPWEGMSGAAVFADGVLVAVVSEHHRAEGANRITARRVESWYDLEPAALTRLSEVLGLPDRDGLAVVGSAGGQTVDAQTRVFVSYSRKDAEFLNWLASGLRDSGCLVDFDQSAEDPSSVATGISAEDAWWTRLEDMITAAEVVVFVVSPDSARSPICDEEIAFAQGLGKRVIPVLWRPIDFAKAPPRLSALNVKISFATPHSDRLKAALQDLATSIHTDVQWFRAATLFGTAARRWDTSGRPADRLLRGVELREAEAWAARRPPSAPRHSESLLAFLAESRSIETERETVASIEQARYRELVEVLKPFLEAEIKVREELPKSGHWGVENEGKQELAFLRSILSPHRRWHPEQAVHVSHTGASEGYAEVFRFPCCQKVVWEYRSAGPNEPPSQLRDDGCKDLPEAARRERRERSNPFTSVVSLVVV